MSIPVFKPSIKRRDMHSVLSCLVTDIIGPSVLKDDLVAVVASELSHEGGFALREYTRSVGLVARSLGLAAGDKVVLSPLAPSAYIRSFNELGIIPVFPDVRESDACMSPDSVSAHMSDEIQAVFLHAPLGQVPDMEYFTGLGIPLVEDIGEALGAVGSAGLLGSAGQYTLIPMEMDGIATSGGGTLVLAKDKTSLTALKDATESFTPDVFLPDLNASLGLVQWREYPQALESRDIIAVAFRQALMKGRHRTFSTTVDEETRNVPYSFPVVLDTGMNDVRRYARKKGIETVPAFSGRAIDGSPGAEGDLSVARNLMMSTLLFPLYPTLGKKNVQHMIKVLSTLP
ncbi:MAG: DegT/DnrJ/EryC1/StrS family aminotransferase [Spirochaetaceae bacterium]|nr:DegT/DnrJ/EryC1/StrS family aminotransferase [Spirochaetaceae bacterium]